MHNALSDNYFVVSLVYSASLGRGGVGGGGGSDQTPHANLPVWCPLRLWSPGLYSPTCPMDNPALRLCHMRGAVFHHEVSSWHCSVLNELYHEGE